VTETQIVQSGPRKSPIGNSLEEELGFVVLTGRHEEPGFPLELGFGEEVVQLPLVFQLRGAPRVVRLGWRQFFVFH